jgi:hypothetical protein
LAANSVALLRAARATVFHATLVAPLGNTSARLIAVGGMIPQLIVEVPHYMSRHKLYFIATGMRRIDYQNQLA